MKIKLKVLRKKISLRKNKLKEQEKDQKPKTILKNGLYERSRDEQSQLCEEKY